MALKVRAARAGSPRQPGEGLRLGTVRLLPRGVRKQDYARLNYFDVWLPSLAPSRQLLAQFKQAKLSLPTFFSRYRREMRQTEPRQTIRLLAAIAERQPISVCCYCEEERRCHRSVLLQLIRTARK